MFNPLTPAELVTMLGGVLRESASWERPLDEFRAAQLLSASSVARHLAAELEAGGAELHRFVEQLTAELAQARAGADDSDWRDALDEAGRRTSAGPDTGSLGTLLVEVLRAARDSRDPTAARFRIAAHSLLADLADRELAMLGRATVRRGSS